MVEWKFNICPGQAINQNYKPRATGSLRHFMLKVFCAILKTAPISVNSSNNIFDVFSECMRCIWAEKWPSVANRGGYLNLVEIKIEIIWTIWSRGTCLTIQLTLNKRKEIEIQEQGTNYVSAPIKNLLHIRTKENNSSHQIREKWSSLQ